MILPLFENSGSKLNLGHKSSTKSIDDQAFLHDTVQLLHLFITIFLLVQNFYHVYKSMGWIPLRRDYIGWYCKDKSFIYVKTYNIYFYL